jgi:hypothetical protein
MGFTFHKSLRLPGGFRLNLSKSGVGASWGFEGFRVGTGPRGSRVNAYIPGTGVGWTSSLGGGRSERPARRAQRELDAKEKQVDAMQERERAAHAAASFDNRIALLTSLHKDAWRPWDWQAVANSPPPVAPAAPAVPPAASAEARPSLMDRMLGADRASAPQPAGPPSAAHAQWQWYQRLAAGIVAGDAAAYEAAIEHLSPFQELAQLGGEIEVTVEDPKWVTARFRANGREAIPGDAVSLTPTGKLSTRKMAVGRFWSIYQDHVCSAVFRVAREIFALLPVELALVHARAFLLDPSTGHSEAPTVVSVAFDRDRFQALNFDEIDPSDALERFPHEMSFSAKRGFRAVDEITMAELVKASEPDDR